MTNYVARSPPIEYTMQDGFISMHPATAFAFDHADVQRIHETIIVTNARTKIAMPGLPIHTLFTRVEFRLVDREVYVQQSASGPLVRLHMLYTHETLGIAQRQIENEVLSLMLRGHSVFVKLCNCKTRVGYKRMLELGINIDVLVKNETACTVAYATNFTAQDIARELGVTDIDAVCVGKDSITAILDNGAFFTRTSTRTRMWRLSDECGVWDKRTLRIYLEMAPHGVNANAPRIQYPELHNDIKVLCAEGALVWLDGAEKSRAGLTGRLFASRLKISTQQRCDDDIIAMWQKSH